MLEIIKAKSSSFEDDFVIVHSTHGLSYYFLFILNKKKLSSSECLLKIEQQSFPLLLIHLFNSLRILKMSFNHIFFKVLFPCLLKIVDIVHIDKVSHIYPLFHVENSVQNIIFLNILFSFFLDKIIFK